MSLTETTFTNFPTLWSQNNHKIIYFPSWPRRYPALQFRSHVIKFWVSEISPPSLSETALCLSGNNVPQSNVHYDEMKQSTCEKCFLIWLLHTMHAILMCEDEVFSGWSINYAKICVRGLLMLNNFCSDVTTPLLQQIGASRSTVLSKRRCVLRKATSYQVFTEAKSSSLNLNSAGSVHPVQGSLQWNSPSQSHIKGLPEISMGLDRGWEIHYGNHSLGPWRRAGKTLEIDCCLLFHSFSLYYYKTLHGQLLRDKTTKNKKYFSSKRHK